MCSVCHRIDLKETWDERTKGLCPKCGGNLCSECHMPISDPIRTERGTWVAATAVPGVGVVVEEMGGSTVTRIILTREAAQSLAEQIELAIINMCTRKQGD